jgi:hypothetical protein
MTDFSLRDVLVAEDAGPPRRRMLIYAETAEQPHEVSGWRFVVSEWDQAGAEQPYWDSWEPTFDEIKRYPTKYASAHVRWRVERTGQWVRLEEITESCFG